MRKEKQLLLDEIKDQLEKSQSLIITKYHRVDPSLSWEFRGELKKAGSNYEVVKKRIFLKAAKELGLEIPEGKLDGHVGVVVAANDGIDATKAVFNFAKNHKGMLDVLGGFYENKYYSSEQVEALSKLPSKDEMRAQLLGLFEAPMSQTLATMDSLLTSVMHCLENKCQKENK